MFMKRRQNNDYELEPEQNIVITEYEDSIDQIRNDNQVLFEVLIKERIRDIHYSIKKRRYELRFIKTDEVDNYLSNWYEIAAIARRYYESLSYDKEEYLQLVDQIETVVAEMYYIIEIRRVFDDDFNLLSVNNVEHNSYMEV